MIVFYRLSAKASFILLRVTPCDDYTTSYSKLTTNYSGERASRGTSLLHRAVALSELRSPSFRLDAVTLMTLPARVLSTGLFSSGQSQTNRSSQVARLCICPQCLAFLSNLNPPIRREFARNLSRERHECPPISSTERPSLVALRHATRHLARSTRLFTPSLLAQSQERCAQDSTTIHRRGRRRRFGSLFPRRVVVVAITTARRSLSLHGAVNSEVISDYDERDCTSHTRATDGRTDGRGDLHAPSVHPRDDASETHYYSDDDEVGCERSRSRFETQQQGVNVIGNGIESQQQRKKDDDENDGDENGQRRRGFRVYRCV